MGIDDDDVATDVTETVGSSSSDDKKYLIVTPSGTGQYLPIQSRYLFIYTCTCMFVHVM